MKTRYTMRRVELTVTPRHKWDGVILLVVGRGSHFQYSEECFLRNVHLADALHAALAFFLFFEQLAFARDVAAVAFGKDVLANRRDRFSRDDAAANRSLNWHFKKLPRNQFPQARYEFAPAVVRKIAVHDQRERIHRLAADQHIELDQIRFAVAREVIVQRS